MTRRVVSCFEDMSKWLTVLVYWTKRTVRPKRIEAEGCGPVLQQNQWLWKEALQPSKLLCAGAFCNPHPIYLSAPLLPNKQSNLHNLLNHTALKSNNTIFQFLPPPLYCFLYLPRCISRHLCISIHMCLEKVFQWLVSMVSTSKFG